MATTTYIIDPFEIATQGLTSGNSLTIASQGFLVTIEEEVTTIDELQRAGGDGGPWDEDWNKWQKDKKVKKITVTVTRGDEIYTKTTVTENLKVSAKDVIVEVVDSKPVIRINLHD